MKWVIFLALLFSACERDFLERYPLDSMSDATFFTSSSDLKTFMNGFYRLFPRYHFQGYGGWGAKDDYLDRGTDIQISTGPDGSLMQQGSSGQAPDADGTWNGNYDWIRQANYFIENSTRVTPRNAEVSHFIGEGYFFRAWLYYRHLVRYGDVPYITSVLNVTDDELYRTRDSRYDVARGILKDLDSAIVNLYWKGEGATAGAGRVNKESALVMKARVALFEGTWERYHGLQGTPFAVSGKDGTDLLQMVEPAIQQLIDHQGTKIFMDGGPLNEPYNQVISQQDGAKTDGVFLYREYEISLIIGHSFFDRINSLWCYTDRLVGSYLDKEGNPQSLSALPVDDNSLYNLAENLDPRFKQTVYTPDKGPLTQLPGLGGTTFLIPSRFALITIGQNNTYQVSGYNNWKGAILDYNEWRYGSTDDVLIRYAEGLLAYAEAKAILGTISQADLNKTVNLLRDRVGMAHMNLGTVNGWPGTLYSLSEGFDPSESNIVNEIRRERLVELVHEGHRLDDLKRWAVYDDAINGYKPKGAHAQQFLDYYNDPAQLIADGFGAGDVGQFALTTGTLFDVDADGYLNPFFIVPDFQAGGNGYYIDANRNYLSPIPKSEIDLYLEKGGVTLTQNPGWF